MKRTLLFCLFTACQILAWTQPTVIYRISAGQLADWQGEGAAPESVFSDWTPVAHYHAPTQPLPDLAYGHYLLLTPEGENLKVSTLSRNHHQVHLHNDGVHLALTVLDSLGQARSDAEVRFDGRPLAYEPQLGLYRRKVGREGVLQVTLPGDTLFYRISAQEQRTVLRRNIDRALRSRPVRYLLTPYHLVRGTFKYVGRGIRWGDWGWYKKPWRWLFPKKDRSITGYVAFNQPRYRPGDTLQLAADVRNAEGRPLQDSIKLTISCHHQGRHKTVLDTLLAPRPPGRYGLRWVLGDTLPLDTRFIVAVGPRKASRYQQLDAYFFLEDYQLDDYQFQLSSSRSTYSADDPIFLIARAEDSNGQPIFGADLQLHLLTDYLDDPLLDSLVVPDTLWSYRTDFGDGPELTIHVPDSIFPIARMQVVAVGRITGSSGEQRESRSAFLLDRPRREARLILSGDSLVAEVLRGGRSVSDSATLYQYVGDNEWRSKAIRLPHREGINPYTGVYWLVTNDSLMAELKTKEQRDLLDIQARLSGDTLWLLIDNPRRLPVSWQLRSAGGWLAEGATSDSSRLDAFPATGEAYQLTYQYPWAGRMSDGRESVQRYKNLLQLQIITPERVYPGQDVPVRVKAVRENGSPAESVALSVGAYNARFEGSAPVQLPDVRYRRRRPPPTRYHYRAAPLAHQPLRPQLLHANWHRRLGLDSLLAYRLRFAASPRYEEYRSIPERDRDSLTGQVVPYIVHQGRLEPIYLIYLDDRLWWYHGTDETTPYSLVATPGHHHLTLRSRTAEYRIDNVRIVRDSQLFLVIDRDRPAPGLTRRERPDHWERDEVALLRNSLFVLREPKPETWNVYFWEDPQRVHRVSTNSGNKHWIIGPFRPNSVLTHYRPFGENNTFLFEPGYAYVLGGQRDRLYNYPLFEENKPYRLPFFRPEVNTHQSAIRPFRRDSRIVGVAPPRIKYAKTPKPADLTTGRLILELPDSLRNNVQRLFFNHQERNGPHFALSGPTTHIYDLPAGRYTLTWLLRDSVTYSLGLTVPAHHWSYLRVDPSQLQAGQSLPQLLAYTYYSELNTAKPNPKTVTGPRRLLQGRVVDETGEPLIGTTILIKGTELGTVTDIDGYYSLWVPIYPPPQLIISYVGYTTQEIFVGERTRIDIALRLSQHTLDEVVVVGYSAGVAPGRARETNSASISVRGIQDELAGRKSAITVRGSRTNANETDWDLGGLPDTGRLRQTFRDYAYWQPYLLTDAKGEVKFSSRFPDDVANWRHYAAGLDQELRVGLGEASTQAFLPLQARLHLPRFLVAGDSVAVRGVVNNFTGDSLAVQTIFADAAGRELQRRQHQLTTGLLDTYALRAAVDQDSLTLRFQLETPTFRDGELRGIAIYPYGVEKTEGRRYVIKRDTSLQPAFSATGGPVSLLFTNNNLDLLLADVDYLVNYRYGCNEQTASRLIGLLALRQIRGYRGDDHRDIDARIQQAIDRLRSGQRPDGGWGWWPNHNSLDWTTLHVLRALKTAEAAGFDVAFVDAAMRQLLQRLHLLAPQEQLPILLQLAEWGQPLDYPTFITRLGRWYTGADPAYTRLRQLAGLPYTLDSLDGYARRDLLGGLYYTRTSNNYFSPIQPSVATTLLMYRLLREAGEREKCHAIQRFFLDRQAQGGRPVWYSTLDRAQILQTLLPDLLDSTKQEFQPVTARLQLADGQSLTLDSFPQTLTLDAGVLSKMELVHSGTGPLFLQASQTYFDATPVPEDHGFQLTSRVLQADRATNFLRTDLPALLEVTVTTQAEGRYVLLEIPVPANCSYGEKIFRELPGEVHREYQRDRVAIFLDVLPAGRHTFHVRLEPRFAGRFALLPARAELMYAPVVNGQAGVGVVRSE